MAVLVHSSAIVLSCEVGFVALFVVRARDIRDLDSCVREFGPGGVSVEIYARWRGRLHSAG